MTSWIENSRRNWICDYVQIKVSWHDKNILWGRLLQSLYGWMDLHAMEIISSVGGKWWEGVKGMLSLNGIYS